MRHAVGWGEDSVRRMIYRNLIRAVVLAPRSTLRSTFIDGLGFPKVRYRVSINALGIRSEGVGAVFPPRLSVLNTYLRTRFSASLEFCASPKICKLRVIKDTLGFESRLRHSNTLQKSWCGCHTTTKPTVSEDTDTIGAQRKARFVLSVWCVTVRPAMYPTAAPATTSLK